jgi:outer membrane protein with beta-barrel domain
MRVLHRVVLAVGSLGLVVFSAQLARADGGDITAGYSYLYDSDSSTGFPAGWFVSAGANITDAFAVVGDVSGHYKSESASSGGVTVSASTHIYAFLAGPRVVGRSGPLGFYGQFLVGAAKASGGATATFGGTTVSSNASDTEFCYAPGAGLDFGVGSNAAARIGVSERLIHSTGGTSKEFQLQLGLVYRFGASR